MLYCWDHANFYISSLVIFLMAQVCKFNIKFSVLIISIMTSCSQMTRFLELNWNFVGNPKDFNFFLNFMLKEIPRIFLQSMLNNLRRSCLAEADRLRKGYSYFPHKHWVPVESLSEQFAIDFRAKVHSFPKYIF